jgi:two-component system, cell cycle sensor histidine kinase and response regulator CckA
MITESAARAIFQEASWPLFIVRDRTIVAANAVALSWLELSEAEVVGASLSRIVHEEDLPRFYERPPERETRIRLRFRRRSGAIEVSTLARRLDEQDQMLCAEVRITRDGVFVLPDETSRMFEQRFLSGFVPMSLTEEDSGRFSLVNDAFVTLVGRSREELIGKTSVELGLFETVDRDALIGVVKREGRLLIDRKTVAKPGGGVRHIRIASERTEIAGKGYLFAVSTDMTDLHNAQRDAERSASRFAAFMNCGLIGITVFDPDRRILEINDEGARMIGLPRERILGRSVREFAGPGVDTASVGPQIQAGALSELSLQQPDGTVVPVLLGSAPLPNEEGCFMTFGVDLTARRELEEKLRLAQRMESLGQLAGGVAHDFNNMLSAILGFGALVATKVRPDDPIQSDVQQIIRAAERAAQLTRQLLAFSRKQMLEPRVVDVGYQIREIEKMLRRLVGEDVSLVLHLAPHLQRVKVDPAQLEQILLNLVINARDAVDEEGLIAVETGNVSLDQEYARTHPGVTQGDYVFIGVSDNGSGMPPHVRARALDPFFTTKGPGKGTGLGLSTVHGIVQQSGGHLWIYSEEGHGTQVKVYLPVTREEPASNTRVVTNATKSSGGETILLAEDEESVRAFLCVALRRAGYTVLAAENGGAALLIAEQHEGKIDLLLTDVVMPRMNGKKLAERLELVRPGLRVIFMSGYTENTIVHRGVVDPGTNFVAKPISLETLRETVRRVLDEREG